MLFIASKYRLKTPLLSSEIAERESIPRKFLELILLQLKNKGLLTSRKGKGGGYLLAREPGQITFGDVIRVFEGSMAPVVCVEPGRQAKCPECPDELPCGIRIVMRELFNVTTGILDGTSLEQANEQTERAEFVNAYVI